MPSLVLVIFLIQVAIYVVNKYGAASVSELGWVLYNKLPTPTSNAVSKSTRQKNEVIRLKTELSRVSAQDDFARWAKLRRQHDKAVADYDKTTSDLATAKAQFTSLLSFARWGGTNGLRLALQFWFARQPMFWIPRGWLPYYVEWILSFPKAPLGGVSIQIWAMACASVIALATEAIEAFAILLYGNTAESRNGTANATPMKQGQGTSDAGSPSGREL